MIGIRNENFCSTEVGALQLGLSTHLGVDDIWNADTPAPPGSSETRGDVVQSALDESVFADEFAHVDADPTAKESGSAPGKWRELSTETAPRYSMP
jgi:hypothetical protein